MQQHQLKGLHLSEKIEQQAFIKKSGKGGTTGLKPSRTVGQVPFIKLFLFKMVQIFGNRPKFKRLFQSKSAVK
jgi:hypothetical protein